MNLKKTGINDNKQSEGYRIFHYPLILILSGVLLITSLKSTAQGDLLVFPKRLIFDETKKSQSINLSNTGKDTARYTISFVQIRMKEDGNFENITQPDPGQYFADPYLRVFPRKVILGPNESQVVKIQLQKVDKMVPGEYRSHIYFRAMPDIKPLGEKETQVEPSEISVKLTPVFGITFPIIIRKGETTASVNLSNVSFQKEYDTIPVLKLDFNRSGNISVYGNIRVHLLMPNGKTIKVGEVDGFAVYTPGEIRKCKIELKKNIDYSKGKLVITYLTSPEDQGIKLAETELVLR